MTMRLFILSLALVVILPAWAKDNEPQLDDMILTEDEYFDLSLEQKVAYAKFFLNYMAEIEDMQDFPADQQSAQWRMPDLFMATADAANWRSALAGQPCLNAMNMSTWVVGANGRVYCQRVPGEDCGGGQVVCAKALLNEVPSLGKICVTPATAGQYPGQTSRCVDKIAQVAGLNLNAHLETAALRYRNGGEAAKYAERSKALKAALARFQKQMTNGVSLTQYCRKTVYQKAECAKIQQLRDAFQTVTTLKQDPYAKGMAYQSSTTQQAALKEMRSKGVQADRIPGAEATRLNGSSDHARSGKKNGSKDAPPVLGGRGENSAPPPASPPRSTPVRSASAGGNCERYHEKLGALACVACGLENAASADISRKGVANWISLLGVSAQTFYGPYGADEGSRRALRQRVIEMVASYGYCTDDQYPISTSPSNSRDWIDGRRPPPREGFFSASAEEKEFSQVYGLKSQGTERMAFAKDLFDDSNRYTGWDVGNVQERQWRFRSRLAAHASTYSGTPLAQCAPQLEDRLTHASAFKMCTSTKGPADTQGYAKVNYPAFIKDNELRENQKLYDAMASACGLPLKRQFESLHCDHVCWGSYVYPTRATQLRNCDGNGAESYSQMISSLGKAGEPSRPRPNSRYGGGHDGPNGDPGGGNNPGGPNGPGGPGGKGGEGAAGRR